MHSLSEYSWRTCYHMWSKLTFKEKGGEKCHVYSTERTRNVTLGATNLTFNGGLWVISEKKYSLPPIGPGAEFSDSASTKIKTAPFPPIVSLSRL